MFLYIALSIIIITYLVARCRKTAGGALRRPPGPPGLPIIGNSHQMDTSKLHLCLGKLAQKYGPLVFMKVIDQPLILISSARVAKEALKHNDLTVSSRTNSICISKLSYNNQDIAFSPYSEYWRDMRKMAVLHLFTQKQVHSFRHVREEEVRQMVKEISKQAESCQLVNINETAMSMATNIICRVGFGKRYDETPSGKRRFDKILEALQGMSAKKFFGDFFPSLGWIDTLCGNVARLEKVFKEMDMFYQELIDEHLSANRPESMNGDILDLLIQLRDDQGRSASSFRIEWDQIKAMLMNVFSGGADTSTATITWGMTALIKKPSVLKKVQQEIRTLIGSKGFVDEDDIEKLSYLKAVLNETLRLYPPVPMLYRKARESCLIDGYDIEPKTYVFVNLWAIGRDPDYWEKPNEFLPERFLDSSINYRGHDFGFIPFGSGRRICPGMALGVVEVELALANLLYSFDWELPRWMVEDDIDTDGLPGIIVLKKNALCLKAIRYK